MREREALRLQLLSWNDSWLQQSSRMDLPKALEPEMGLQEKPPFAEGRRGWGRKGAKNPVRLQAVAPAAAWKNEPSAVMRSEATAQQQ
ncbi:hypothetical protein NDU88_005444 [Pleurodeles waltl]|uniref:Uncharacterized protein n=1 Tax=Pleurodeles waltl TaxID=8319 RepID=A0AAV7MWA8_PLEWA|nr:hypothetical protein NDU88_005444 [Pleurodeles waltl]